MSLILCIGQFYTSFTLIQVDLFIDVYQLSLHTTVCRILIMTPLCKNEGESGLRIFRPLRMELERWN